MMTDNATRVYFENLPRADDAEAALLGALLLEPDRLAEMDLEPRHFYLEKHRHVFAALLDLRGEGQGIDLITLAARLERDKKLETVGGQAFLISLLTGTPTAAHTRAHADLVHNAYLRRRVWYASENLSRLALAKDAEPPQWLAAVEEAFDDVRGALAGAAHGDDLKTMSADEICMTEWAAPRWAIPNLLPVGLTILAGAPKLGKSWLALQIAHAVAAGGIALGAKVERGAVLYLALEDSPRRLKERMLKQSWTRGLDADFLTIGEFAKQVGDLKNGGGEKLARQIETRGYRLVVIDTLSRAIQGDQNDAAQMTRGLTPLQEIAHAHNVATILIDHHRKVSGAAADVITDILGSTAKGAMCDTSWGLYRERGKAGAKLAITGREVEEKTLALTMDWLTGVWQSEGDYAALELTQRRQEILSALKELGRAQLGDIVKAIGQPESNTHNRLQDMANAGFVKRTTEGKKVYYELPSQ
jgi:hypothetical protein